MYCALSFSLFNILIIEYMNTGIVKINTSAYNGPNPPILVSAAYNSSISVYSIILPKSIIVSNSHQAQQFTDL